jgi:hypothetical protein
VQARGRRAGKQPEGKEQRDEQGEATTGERLSLHDALLETLAERAETGSPLLMAGSLGWRA